MLTLAGEFEKHGYKVSFIDAEVELLSDEEVFSKVLEIKPDMVGFYCITANFKRITQLSVMIKEKLNSLVFFGGPHVWHNWLETMNTNAVDFVVVGEAEKSCIEVLDKLSKGESLRDVKAYHLKRKMRSYLQALDLF